MTEQQADARLAYWLDQLHKAEKAEYQYRERAKKIVRRYRDERAEHDKQHRLNILWSNVQTLTPALYAATPKPQIERRYKDADPFARQAAFVLERAVATSLETGDFDQVMHSCVLDLLLVGRAVARVRYVPVYEEMAVADEGAEIYVGQEKLACDYVYWEDFLHAPARRWADVAWVAFRNHMTADELRKRFPDMAEECTRVFSRASDGTWQNAISGKIAVWEIWDKTSRQVHWLLDSGQEKHSMLLETRDDPLQLQDFFPCPPPLLATTSNDQLIPVPDYLLYQDQAIELDVLTSRIQALAKMIRMRGLYDASLEPVQRLLGEGGVDGQLIPVEQWNALSQKGGIDSVISWLPIERMVQVLGQLYQARDRVKNDLYEITGIADILRGATIASETATAQQLKGRFATLRLGERQKEVARFSRDLVRLQSELIAEHFSPESLAEMTGLTVVPAMMELFRNEKIRNWRIGIETDSTIAADEFGEKQTRIEFLNAVTGFIKEAAPLVQAGALPLPIAKAMLLFGVRGFRVGRELETALESLDQFQQPAAPGV